MYNANPSISAGSWRRNSESFLNRGLTRTSFLRSFSEPPSDNARWSHDRPSSAMLMSDVEMTNYQQENVKVDPGDGYESEDAKTDKSGEIDGLSRKRKRQEESSDDEVETSRVFTAARKRMLKVERGMDTLGKPRAERDPRKRVHRGGMLPGNRRDAARDA
ncbi:hypothetical protein QFC24_006488 [Naganishia onofrii]|uniref:Uncharacterized protein n=1 Tax=Naganishia onofrii TaxID=1851511 RepID=A0ACC2X3R7_9TREE|nr:hypothetical protein QFC24_006488 [Naganishia onofrii]